MTQTPPKAHGERRGRSVLTKNCFGFQIDNHKPAPLSPAGFGAFGSGNLGP